MIVKAYTIERVAGDKVVIEDMKFVRSEAEEEAKKRAAAEGCEYSVAKISVDIPVDKPNTNNQFVYK